MATEELSLEKFGSIGGSYFEVLIALALDDLGYVEGENYLASWAKKCVPGTWIEADFIISSKKDRSKDPLNNGRIVFAVGHATSENSAGMKFHRDVEQLLEVKALPNGDEYRVIDILFCCPRETMGGWSKEFVAINEAVFDDHLIVWKHDWGRRLLYCIQQSAAKVTEGTPAAKKERLRSLIAASPAFTRSFGEFRSHLSTMLGRKTSASKIHDMFVAEREQRPHRLARDLLIREPRETDFKRGLLQALALNDWELELLYENHQRNRSGRCSLEKLAAEKGVPSTEFDKLWVRLGLLAVRVGTLRREVEEPGTELTEDEVRWFQASEQLAYVFEHFDLAALREVARTVPKVAPNLMPYLLDLRDLSRAELMCAVLHKSGPRKFVELCQECYANDPWQGIGMPRLLIFEVAKSAVASSDRAYSYDVLANESGNNRLIQYPGFFRGIHPGKRGNPETPEFLDGCRSLAQRLSGLGARYFDVNRGKILGRFVYDRFDGLVKQPKESVLDALVDAQVRTFAGDISATVGSAMQTGIESALGVFAGTANSGVNVEVPYVLHLKGRGDIYIHRVMSDGGVGHKRKEFSSKVRSIRYASTPDGKVRRRSSLLATILIIDGNWVTPDLADQLTAIRMLTVAGWDHVVFPDQLAAALTRVKADLKLKATAPVAGKVVA
jgi:hypothetical protein